MANFATSAGTTAYLASCTTRIRDTFPDFPLEPVIFQSILLCLVAGCSDETSDGQKRRKNLILRTREEDVGLVSNLAHMVSTPRRIIQQVLWLVMHTAGFICLQRPSGPTQMPNVIYVLLSRRCLWGVRHLETSSAHGSSEQVKWWLPLVPQA